MRQEDAMSTRTIQALVNHADKMSGRPTADIALSAEERAELHPLMTIAEQLKETMVPIEPPAAFVLSLGQELREAALQQKKNARQFRRSIFIGAAALGSVISVAGVVTLIVRRRRGAAHP
jgi:hypothetical protein